MIQLVPVTSSLDLGDDLKQIYFESFPADERREWEDIHQLLYHPPYNLYRINVNNELTGLISIWRWPELIFIEHFALSIPNRELGTGTQVLKQIISENPPTIILEVELPDTEQAIRRIAFYERLGFSLCIKDYYQPPYFPGKNKVKMLLMSFPHSLSPDEFQFYRTKIYKEVYPLYNITDFP
ncbi:MAG: GNAT family N-acetyltransferase [Verrucomicrobia bacterium]|nr:GNAT family N-acetyltransferase [Prolixibacteraceae bacterium]